MLKDILKCSLKGWTSVAIITRCVLTLFVYKCMFINVYYLLSYIL